MISTFRPSCLGLLFLTLLLACQVASAAPLPGQIVIDPDDPRWLKRHGGSHLFICGPGDPEDFLYRGTRNPDGTRAGDQVALIRKLIEHGGNSIYLQAVRTHGGDAGTDTTHNPFLDSDPAKGLDERILAQWEEWFTLMDDNGIVIYFLFYDDSARIWNTGDQVGEAERAFLEGIVRRFSHHRNLIWLFGEESEERYTHARVNAAAGILQRTDPHGHVIGNHHLNGTTFKAWRPGSALRHFSMQMKAATGPEAHAAALGAFRNAAGRYQVIYSESTTTPPDAAGMRRHAWASAMAGVMPMLLQMDIANTPVEALQQCRHLQRFFEATDFFTMAPHDELKHAGSTYVLADLGRSYIAYGDNVATELGVSRLPVGKCTVTWLDCVTGRTATEQHQFAAVGARSFRKPAQFGSECAVWIRFPEIPRRKRDGRAPEVTVAGTPRTNQPPVVEDQEFSASPGSPLYLQLSLVDDDGPGPYTYTIVQPPRHGRLTGENNDRTYTADPGFAGEDSFAWKANDGAADSRTARMIIRVAQTPAERPQSGAIPAPKSKAGARRQD